MTRIMPIAIIAAAHLAACQPGQVATSNETGASADLRACGSGTRTPGIDVSSLDGKLSWSSMARAGKRFAFMRASDGYTGDSRFAGNWQGFADAGMYRGAYHFFRPSEDPVAQADLFLDQVGSLGGDHDLPPVLDLEVRGGMNASTVATRALVWLERVEAALGKRPIVYTGVGFQAAISDPSSLAAYSLWVANWTTSCPSMPARWKTWTFWQNGVGAGNRSAVSGLDLDELAGSEDDLAAMAGQTE